MNTIAVLLGAAVRRFRKQRSLSQEELAAQAGIHYTALNGIETGQRLPSLRTLNKIARAFRISLWEIMLLAEPEYRKPYLDEVSARGVFKKRRKGQTKADNKKRKM